MKKAFLLCSLILGTLGCSTSYHAQGWFGGGYSEYRVNQDKFAITFRGNEYTNPEKVRRFALKRAAEVAIQHGFQYFTVLTDTDVSVKREEIRKRPGVDFMIKCFKEKPNDDAINAQEYLVYNPEL